MAYRRDEEDSISCSASTWSGTTGSWTSWRTSSGTSSRTSSKRWSEEAGRDLRFHCAINVAHSSDTQFGNTLHYHGPVTLRVEDSKFVDALPLALAAPPANSFANRVTAELKKLLRWPRIGLLVFLLLTVLLVTLSSFLLTAYFNGDFDMDAPANVTLVTRDEWGATREKFSPLNLPSPMDVVILHHTNAATCFNFTDCPAVLVDLQSQHFRNGWADIAYNFMVAGDGSVYEGRGWDKAGAHTLNWNTHSVGVALVGTFSYDAPPATQMEGLADFLRWAVQQGRLERRYRLLGQCQVRNAPSPGAWVMDAIRQWRRWWSHTEGDHSCS